MTTNSNMTFSAVEEQIKARIPPFDFPSSKQCQTAINQLRKSYGHCLGKTGIDDCPLTITAVDAIFARIEKTAADSNKERRKRNNVSTRLRQLARIVSDTPTSSPAWNTFENVLIALADEDGVPGQKLIPIRNTLKVAALEDGLGPAEMTSAWLIGRMQRALPKRRESLRDGAKLLNQWHDRLPDELRPPELFCGLSDMGGGQRRSGPLPSNVAADLLRYRDNRVNATFVQGLQDVPILAKEGIKADSTVIYDQALKWYFDSLRVSGLVTLETMPGSLAEAACLDRLSKVVFQAIDDHASFEEGGEAFLPWDPIKPKTIQARTKALCRMFSDMRPDFRKQEVQKLVAGGQAASMDAKEVVSMVSDWVDGDGMTPYQRRFCLALIRDEDRQRLLLNMHTIAWEEAQKGWAQWLQLDKSAKRSVIDLCVLAAILAVVVHYPFRARTVTELTVFGAAPDVILPPRKSSIDFSVFRDRIKNKEDFDAILEDTRHSQPRKILDWFMAGPRHELLRDPALLAVNHRRPECLFAGFPVARYGKVLSEWTEMQGMRMTTHGFRHAIATILVNLCDARLEDVARMLGNKNVEIVSRHYVMIDGIRRRSKVLARVHDHRKHLNEMRHPGRRST